MIGCEDKLLIVCGVCLLLGSGWQKRVHSSLVRGLSEVALLPMQKRSKPFAQKRRARPGLGCARLKAVTITRHPCSG